jgi:hypothetical protein
VLAAIQFRSGEDVEEVYLSCILDEGDGAGD